MMLMVANENETERQIDVRHARFMRVAVFFGANQNAPAGFHRGKTKRHQNVGNQTIHRGTRQIVGETTTQTIQYNKKYR